MGEADMMAATQAGWKEHGGCISKKSRRFAIRGNLLTEAWAGLNISMLT